jgi:hypothetical protein
MGSIVVVSSETRDFITQYVEVKDKLKLPAKLHVLASKCLNLARD